MSGSWLDNAVQAIRSSQPPAGMPARIIAVDGPGGAGKSTLAECLAHQLGALIISADDFASWEIPMGSGAALLETVLIPIAAGQSVEFEPTAWGGSPKARVLIEPAEFMILEGVGSSREEFRPYLSFCIWVETPRELRLRRGLLRDGEDAGSRWRDWMAAEDAYIERERPAEHADLVLPGDEGLWS